MTKTNSVHEKGDHSIGISLLEAVNINIFERWEAALKAIEDAVLD